MGNSMKMFKHIARSLTFGLVITAVILAIVPAKEASVDIMKWSSVLVSFSTFAIGLVVKAMADIGISLTSFNPAQSIEIRKNLGKHRRAVLYRLIAIIVQLIALIMCATIIGHADFVFDSPTAWTLDSKMALYTVGYSLLASVLLLTKSIFEDYLNAEDTRDKLESIRGMSQISNLP